MAPTLGDADEPLGTGGPLGTFEPEATGTAHNFSCALVIQPVFGGRIRTQQGGGDDRKRRKRGKPVKVGPGRKILRTPAEEERLRAKAEKARLAAEAWDAKKEARTASQEEERARREEAKRAAAEAERQAIERQRERDREDMAASAAAELAAKEAAEAARNAEIEQVLNNARLARDDEEAMVLLLLAA
jgi:membrane protein involved in colicin uptake